MASCRRFVKAATKTPACFQALSRADGMCREADLPARCLWREYFGQDEVRAGEGLIRRKLIGGQSDRMICRTISPSRNYSKSPTPIRDMLISRYNCQWHQQWAEAGLAAMLACFAKDMRPVNPSAPALPELDGAGRGIT